MKNIISITFGFILATAITLSAQSKETRTMEDFDGIKVSSSVDAELNKGSKNEVNISVRGADLEDVITEVEDGILVVTMRKNWSKRKWNNKTKILVKITYTEDPSLISVSSSSDLIAHDVIKTKKLKLKASSSADMRIEVDVEELIAQSSSSSDIEIEGRADDVKITASSSSDFLGKNLKQRRLN